MDPTTFKLITVIEKFSPKKIAFDQNPNPTKITKINKSFKPQNKRKKEKKNIFLRFTCNNWNVFAFVSLNEQINCVLEGFGIQ